MECTSPSNWSPLMLNSATNFRLSGEVPLSPLQGVPSSGLLSRWLCLVRGSISSSMFTQKQHRHTQSHLHAPTHAHYLTATHLTMNEQVLTHQLMSLIRWPLNRILLSSVLPTTGRGGGTVPLHCRGGVAIKVLQARASGTSSSLTDYKQTQQSLQSTCYN